MRDENEQARYITELLDIFSTEGVDSVFVYTFARYDLANRSGPHEDFDMASAGLVKVLDEGRRGQRYPDMSWEPKAAFTALATCYCCLAVIKPIAEEQMPQVNRHRLPQCSGVTSADEW